MTKCPLNKNVSTIKTNLVVTGMDGNVTLLVASKLVSSSRDNDLSSSAGSCNTDSDIVNRFTPIRMINIEDDVCHESEETIITNILQFALNNVEDIRAR